MIVYVVIEHVEFEGYQYPYAVYSSKEKAKKVKCELELSDNKMSEIDVLEVELDPED